MEANYPGWLWMEPAQFIGRVDDLASLYTEIREHYQNAIDEAFDKVSRQIGFVVLTSIPITVTVDNNGRVSQIEMAVENMKGTLFESVKDVLKPMMKQERGETKGKTRVISKGDYQIVVFWKAGLKAIGASLQGLIQVPGEPAHYSIPGSLAARLGRILPEPAHYSHFEPAHYALRNAVANELRLLRHEPVQFTRWGFLNLTRCWQNRVRTLEIGGGHLGDRPGLPGTESRGTDCRSGCGTCCCNPGVPAARALDGARPVQESCRIGKPCCIRPGNLPNSLQCCGSTATEAQDQSGNLSFFLSVFLASCA